jgi:hypothetical protein
MLERPENVTIALVLKYLPLLFLLSKAVLSIKKQQ